ncbi:hypothetical protein SAHL_06545 [Salinisphaera orenii YIM 95161]|uniref:Uncharacterized protein n=1 Tax=Salinisphaera orenii YIM 95161 TaxID=1051139 RepID=A0A423Q066_9GAMM|nr:hypothetical protein SAHL_06545 [Salinisphaera halophila YIM 95161]
MALFMTCLHLTATRPFDLASFHQLVNFWAIEPFQHRVLLPSLVGEIQRLAPVGEKLLFGLLQFGFWIALIQLADRALAMFDIGRTPPARRLLALTVVVPMLLHLIMPDIELTRTFALDDGVLDVGTWETRDIYYYVYDVPAAVFTLAMAMLLIRLARRPDIGGFIGYLALFAVATLNRETTLFMLPFSALLFWRVLGIRDWLLLMAAQAAMFTAIQMPLQWLFAININPIAMIQVGDSQYELHLLGNLATLSNPLYLMTFIARFAAGLCIPLFLCRHYLDRHLALALLGFALPLALSALVVGRIVEHRVFIEMIPLVWLATLQAVARRSAHTSPDRRLAAMT